MFYDNLKAECDRQGLKITPIVLECGGNKGSLSGWKKGASPNSDIVAKLSVRLNVPTDLLIFGKESSNLPNISNSTVGAVGSHSSGTININSNPVPVESKSENNEINTLKQTVSEITREIIEISESLPIRERVKLLNMVYDFEDKYKKSHE